MTSPSRLRCDRLHAEPGLAQQGIQAVAAALAARRPGTFKPPPLRLRHTGALPGFDPRASNAVVTLALSEHPVFVLMSRLLAFLAEAASGIELRIRDVHGRDDAVALLDAGEVDLAVGVPPTLSTGRILTQPLFEEDFVCMLRKDHPAARKRLDLRRFLALSHLLVSPENDRFGLVDAQLAKQGLKRRLGLALPHMYAAPMLVARSYMVATLMRGVVEASGHANELRVLPPPLALGAVPFVMAWHRRNDAHPAQRWLRESLAALMQPPARPGPRCGRTRPATPRVDPRESHALPSAPAVQAGRARARGKG